MTVGKLWNPALDFQNVPNATGNGTATLKYEVGKALHRVQLVLDNTAKVPGNFTKSMITLIRIKVNAVTRYETTGDILDAINKYNGIYNSTNYLTIDFTNIFGRDYVDQVMGVWDTSVGMNTVSIEVTIAGATGPLLSANLDESAAQSINPKTAPFAGAMKKLVRYPWTRNTGGQLPVDLPFGKEGAVIMRMYITHTGNLTDVEVKENKVTVWKSNIADAEFVQNEYVKVPQANMMVVDFVVDNNIKNAWDTRQDEQGQPLTSVTMLLNVSAADSGYVTLEALDNLTNL